MENNKPVVIIPNGIYKQLSRNSLTINDVLDLQKLINIFSTEDLVFLLSVNNNPSYTFDINNLSLDHLSNSWSTSDYYTNILNLIPIYSVDILSKLSLNGVEEDNAYFELVDSIDVIYCITKPYMYTNIDIAKLVSKEMTCKILESLFKYNDYNVVAKNPLFNGYVKNLS